MTDRVADMSAELPCYKCGYDLRAHAPDAKCPECGALVAESLRVAAIPRRPAWRDSDPRWRRRVLAGVWVLVLLPLMDVLQTFGWASRVTVPNVFGFRGALRLDDTFLSNMDVYPALIFCIGVVLLFSKEQGRRRGQLDWTRRWGVICSYVVLLLSAVRVLVIGALVLLGISALFLSMPPKYQPKLTPLFVDVSTAYLRYGPYPKWISDGVLVAFSSIAILLACVPLFDALRSCGPKRVAAILLAPLALFSLMHLAQAGRFCLGGPSATLLPSAGLIELYHRGSYFWPGAPVEYLAGRLTDLSWLGLRSVGLGTIIVEAAKWCIILAVAVWLSVAQLRAWWQGKKTSEPMSGRSAG